jgi:hypothetical protein
MSTHPLLSVYDGQTCVGFVLDRGRAGYEAFGADAEQSLGVFETREAAIESVWDPPDKEKGLAGAANTGKAREMVDQLKRMTKTDNTRDDRKDQARREAQGKKRKSNAN